MTKTTTTITSLILAVTFLAATQVQAELLTHTFDFRIAPNSKNQNMASVADVLTLTATDNGKTGSEHGIDFVLSSTWAGDNGGPGILMPYAFDMWGHELGYDPSNTGSLMDANYVSLYNYSEMFANSSYATGNPDKIVKSGSYAGGRMSTSGFQQSEENIWNTSFTLNYAGDNNWSNFLDLFVDDNPLTEENEAENGFYLSVTLGELDGSRSSTSFATFDTAIPAIGPGEGEVTTAAPEPATLAMLGLGLAGLGLVSRRRRK